MEVHDIYNILLHILFLFCILTALFWFIISKEMQNETTRELSNGVTTSVKNFTKNIKLTSSYMSNCNVWNFL